MVKMHVGTILYRKRHAAGHGEQGLNIVCMMVLLHRGCTECELVAYSLMLNQADVTARFRSQKPIAYLLQRDGKKTTSSPSGHDIGYTSLRGHSLLPADHSGPIASGGLPLPPFYYESVHLVK